MTTDRSSSVLLRIIDDDASLLEAIAFVLEGEGWQTACYSSAENFLEADNPALPGAILLDVRMGGMSGPQLQETLLRLGCRLPVIFLSAHGSIDLAVELMQKGAVSFLPKPVSAEKLIQAVERALSTLPVYGVASPAMTPTAVSLTDREEQVVRCVADGLTNRQTAERLGIALRTVEYFRAGAMRKLGAHNATELKQIYQHLRRA